MHDTLDPMDDDGAADGDQRSTAKTPRADESVPAPESTEPSTVLAEVLPGIAVVFGDVPPDLEAHLHDFGLVSTADRVQLSAALGAMGGVATTAGNIGTAVASARGLYRLSDTSQALLDAGGKLAVKDGANLGTILNGQGIAGQARFIPLSAVNVASMAAAIGPALAAIAIQMQLSEITRLVRTNIVLTTQVLGTVRAEQWSELTGLVGTIDRVVDQARELESVPDSLWHSVAGAGAILSKQRDLYRGNVRRHIHHLKERSRTAQREYLQTNAEAIVFETHALLSSLKAWTGYQALRAGKARTAGRDDVTEARLVDLIARDTSTELGPALAETRSLVDSLTRELRILAELPGRGSAPSFIPWGRKDAKATREISAGLLAAIEPLAEVLHPSRPTLGAPDVLCVPVPMEVDRLLQILSWFMHDDESLRALAFVDELDADGGLSSLLGGALDFLPWGDKAETRTTVAITNHRIVTARTDSLLQEGRLQSEVGIDDVRYIRAATTGTKNGRAAVDLITRDANIRWVFPDAVDDGQVGAFVAVLAESMSIPDIERATLLSRRLAPIEAGPDDAADVSAAPE